MHEASIRLMFHGRLVKATVNMSGKPEGDGSYLNFSNWTVATP